MNHTVSLMLTAAVSISTIIYTFYSIQLWRTSRAAAEISRQTALGNLWSELNRYIESLRQQNAPEVPFLQQLSDLFLEFMITNLIVESGKKENREAITEFRQKVSALMAENEAYASKYPWITRFAGWR